jgi:hypothetical protein
MGLLDDAIREHLDLKRRRGADPAEVERAEQEALGPVRRGPERAEMLEPELDDELAQDHLPAYDHEDDADHLPDDNHQGGSDGLHAPDLDEPGWGDAGDEEPAHPPPAPAGRSRPVPAPEGPPEDPDIGDLEKDDADPASAKPSKSPQPLGDETAEYNVEEALENEPENLLEETPEFLQDTPDHDRLWFEQKPPRDFKFDS